MSGFEPVQDGTESPAPADWSALSIRKSVPANVVEKLAAPSPAQTALAIGSVLTGIVGLITCAILIETWWVNLIVIVFIAGRQHAMLILMHDAAHRLLLPNARFNDIVSNVLLSFPLFISTELYRKHHLQHHRYVNTKDDPDLNDAEIPSYGALFLAQLLGDLIGLRTLRLMASVNNFGVLALFRPGSATIRNISFNRGLFVAFAGAQCAVLTLIGGWQAYFLYWIVPMWFVLPPILHLRAVAEHAGRIDENDCAAYARTVRCPTWERALICPMNINLHLEHHIFPEVPCYRLPEVSVLLDQVPGLTRRITRNRGYLIGRESVLAELYGGRWRKA